MLAMIRSLLRSNARLRVENAALRQQLAALRKDSGRRIRLSRWDRLLWIGLRRCWSSWREALVFVRPETVLRWHRQGLRWWWRRRSGGGGGRPRIPRAHIAMIRQISGDHPEWGEDRIAAELSLKLGVEHAPSTIRRYLVRGRGPSRDTWRRFVARHASSLVAIDFVLVWLWHAVPVFVLVVLAVDTRQVLGVAVARRPGLDWVKAQLSRVLQNSPGRTLVLHDNDGIYAQYGRPRMVEGRRVRSNLDGWLWTALGRRGLASRSGRRTRVRTSSGSWARCGASA